MTTEMAALLGMGAVLVFGLVALFWALSVHDDRKQIMQDSIMLD